MKILVTGGTGFIGNHLCRKLINDGNYVICLDNNFTGNMRNIQDLLEHPNFTFIYHDVINPIEIDMMDMDIKFKDVEQIYHLACPASPKAYQYDSIKTLKTNFLGTLHVLGLAKCSKARVLLTSTSEIYGDPHINPQVEEYWGNVNPIGIRSCYDEGKRVAETLMMEYHKNHHVDIRIARIFNTYGPFMNKEDGRVVSNFINQMLENKNITIYGDGNQTRSFCYIQDTVNGLVKLMNNNETIGPINIGNPHEITVHDLVTILFSMIHDTKSKIIYEPLPSDDPHIRRPDISKAEKFLDWTPIVTLNEGLKYTIDYFQRYKSLKDV
jgi:UDP-glucuronate decarboxylase